GRRGRGCRLPSPRRARARRRRPTSSSSPVVAPSAGRTGRSRRPRPSGAPGGRTGGTTRGTSTRGGLPRAPRHGRAGRGRAVPGGGRGRFRAPAGRTRGRTATPPPWGGPLNRDRPAARRPHRPACRPWAGCGTRPRSCPPPRAPRPCVRPGRTAAPRRVRWGPSPRPRRRPAPGAARSPERRQPVRPAQFLQKVFLAGRLVGQTDEETSGVLIAALDVVVRGRGAARCDPVGEQQPHALLGHDQGPQGL